jgi:hypothetical protein
MKSGALAKSLNITFGISFISLKSRPKLLEYKSLLKDTQIILQDEN